MRRRDLLLMFSAGVVVSCLPSGSAGAAPEIPGRSDAIRRSLAEWKAKLTPDQYHILFEKGTERAFTGAWWNHHEDGTYHCAACDLPLFDSRTKFDSGTGWPSFWQPIGKDNVAVSEDRSWSLMVRTEVLCNRCGGHQGHVFTDGPQPTGLRYCINSASLAFHPRTAKPG